MDAKRELLTKLQHDHRQENPEAQGMSYSAIKQVNSGLRVLKRVSRRSEACFHGPSSPLSPIFLSLRRLAVVAAVLHGVTPIPSLAFGHGCLLRPSHRREPGDRSARPPYAHHPCIHILVIYSVTIGNVSRVTVMLECLEEE